jgi:hypothetical protein
MADSSLQVVDQKDIIVAEPAGLDLKLGFGGVHGIQWGLLGISGRIR